MKRLLSLLLIIGLVIGAFPPTAKAEDVESTRKQANQYIASKHEFKGLEDFFSTSINISGKGKQLRYVTYDTAADMAGFKKLGITIDPKYAPKLLVYGEGYGFNPRFGVNRYVGYTVQGQPYGNPAHPFDAWSGGKVEDRPWISNPWENKLVWQYIANELHVTPDQVKGMMPAGFSTALKNDPLIREKIRWGMLFNKYNGQPIIGPCTDPKYQNYPWEDKMIIYQPPTPVSWGYGRMFQVVNGRIWYLSVMIPNNIPTSPDFFPTPEGSEVWKPEYKDPNTCAKTYNYKPDQTSITIPVTLRNQGEKAISDFKAVWFGSSAVNPNTWNQPLWQAEIKEPIEKDKPQTFNVTIPLPVPEYSKGIVAFKANVDGQTPEVEQDNNLMFIKLASEGVDVVAEMSEGPFIYDLRPGEKANVFLSLFVSRKDKQKIPVNADVTYSGPFGTVKKKAIVGYHMDDSFLQYNMEFTLSAPGAYKVRGSAWPTELTDIDPSNNTDELTVVVKYRKSYPKSYPQKINSERVTRVNLRD